MTLRLRVLLAVGLVGVMVVATAWLTTRIATQRLRDQVDSRLTFAVPPGGRFDGPEPPDDRIDNDRTRFNPFYVGRIADGKLVTIANPNLTGSTLAPPALTADRAVSEAAVGRSAPFTVAATSGDLDYRVVARRAPDGSVFVIGAPLDEVASAVAQIRNVSWAIAAIVLLILAVIAWWVLRLGVRPVQRMNEVAAAIASDDLSGRVPNASVKTEAGQLGATLNSMLDRLETSFAAQTTTEARLRRFVADASHELRTPVQTIRGYAELYRIGALEDAAQLDDAMRRTEAESVRMAVLVDELLALARLDQASELLIEPVDLAQLAHDAAADARAVQPERSITVIAAASETVAGDEHHLRRVVGNVVTNALTHTPTSAAIVIRVASSGEHATIAVHDDGPGMDSGTRDRAFERFYRGDPSRSRSFGGSGLGLAIVQASVDAHGGTVTLESAPGQGTTVTVTLPR